MPRASASTYSFVQPEVLLLCRAYLLHRCRSIDMVAAIRGALDVFLFSEEPVGILIDPLRPDALTRLFLARFEVLALHGALRHRFVALVPVAHRDAVPRPFRAQRRQPEFFPDGL